MQKSSNTLVFSNETASADFVSKRFLINEERVTVIITASKLRANVYNCCDQIDFSRLWATNQCSRSVSWQPQIDSQHWREILVGENGCEDSGQKFVAAVDTEVKSPRPLNKPTILFASVELLQTMAKRNTSHTENTTSPYRELTETLENSHNLAKPPRNPLKPTRTYQNFSKTNQDSLETTTLTVCSENINKQNSFFPSPSERDMCHTHM